MLKLAALALCIAIAIPAYRTIRDRSRRMGKLHRRAEDGGEI